MDPEMYLQIQGKTREEAIEESAEDAARGLRREAVLAAVAEAEDIEVSEEELLEALQPPAGQKGKPEKLLKRLRAEGRDVLLIEELKLNKAADVVVDSAKPVEMDQAETREKLWTPEGEGAGSGEGASDLWTPGDD
jgi:trigger factor